MSTPSRPPKPTARASRRRVRFGATTAIVIVAVTVSVVILNALAQRYSVRWDATATGEHHLAPRTLSLLSRLDKPYQIVIAGKRSAMDPRALDGVLDVLDKFARSSRQINATFLDTGSAGGPAEMENLVQQLAQRDAQKIQAQAATLAAALAGIQDLAKYCETLSPGLQAVRDAIPLSGATPELTGIFDDNRAYFDQRSAVVRLCARDLNDAAKAAKEVAAVRIGSVVIPDADELGVSLRAKLRDTAAKLGSIAENTRRCAESGQTPAAARDAARALLPDLAAQRDRAAVLQESLGRMVRLDITRVARILESGSAALVIGPPEAGLTAVDFETLFPPKAVIDASGGRADVGRQAEELLATGLASLANPIKPVVVLVHPEPGRIFEQVGYLRRINPSLAQRLELRGIDVAEWATAVDPEPPSSAALDPTGKRPIVYVALGANTASAADPARGTASGPERATRLGKCLTALADSGKPLLFSIAPSTLPGYGEVDPTVAFLAGFGLRADSGRPLMHERAAPTGRLVETDQRLTAMPGDHVLSGAIHGLPTVFTWPIALERTAPAPQVQITPLFSVTDEAAWGEAQWLSYWQVPLAQRPSVTNPPAKDPSRDNVTGPWTIALAAERTTPAKAAPQRLVVIGSSGWFTDPITQQEAQIDGRRVSVSPGNVELFESAVFWLAGQDELIAQSPTARAVPLVRPLADGQLRAIRWLVIAVLPLLVLAVGALWRWWHG